jgi:hypothetical protein
VRGGLEAVARTKFVRRSDGRRELSHQSELTTECYLRQARMMEPSPSRLPRSLPPGAAAASTPITSSGQWWESALSHVGGGDCGMQDAALAEGALLQPASSAIGGAARLRAVPRQEGGLSQQPQPPSATPSTALLTASLGMLRSEISAGHGASGVALAADPPPGDPRSR